MLKLSLILYVKLCSMWNVCSMCLGNVDNAYVLVGNIVNVQVYEYR